MVWLLIVALLLIIALIWLLSKPFYWHGKNIPYLIPMPIFGSILPSLRYGLIKNFNQLNKNFPGHKFYGLHFFTRPTLLIKDIKLIQRILVTDFEHFTSHSMYSNQDRDAAGGNLFHIHGEQWKEVRGKVSQYFTPAKVKVMLQYINNTMPKVNRVIDKKISSEEPIEISSILLSSTIDIITQAIFGVKSGTFEDKNSIFYKLGGKLFRNEFTYKLFTSVLSPKLYDLFKLTVFGCDLNIVISNIVQRTIDYRRKENIYIQDFLQGMMEIMEENTRKAEIEYFPDKTRVPRYDLDTVITQGIILFIGGVETTQLSMTFFLYEMARNPEIQDRCRAEINSVVEDGNLVTVDDLPKLVYLQAAIQETIRLHSPFSMINRECTKEYKIPDSDFTIEQGTFILICPKAIQVAEENFPEPEVFRPERFLEEGKDSLQPGTYLPFSLGPRTCVGMSFAQGELRFVLSRLLQRYEFSVCSKTQIPVKYAKYRFLTTPKNGMWLRVRPIEMT